MIGENPTKEEIADAILSSEEFMWLMCGGDPDWIQSRIKSLRPAWHKWLEAGGKSWGKE